MFFGRRCAAADECPDVRWSRGHVNTTDRGCGREPATGQKERNRNEEPSAGHAPTETTTEENQRGGRPNVVE